MLGLNERTRAYISLVFMPLFFSSNLVLGRSAIEIVEPWTAAYWRWGLASLILFPFAIGGVWRCRDALLANWRLLFVFGFLGMIICGGGVYVSLRYTTATNATLIYTTSPIFVLLLELVFRRQPVSPRQVLGVVLAVFGIVEIVLRGDPARLLSLKLNGGDLGILFAAFSWAVYSVLLRRPAFQALPTLPLFLIIALVGTAMLTPLMLWETVAVGPMPMVPRAWASLVGLAVIASVLPFLAYQYGVKVVGPSITSMFLYLLPAFGVLMAAVFLGEELHLYHGIGFVLVTAGVILATAKFGGGKDASTT